MQSGAAPEYRARRNSVRNTWLTRRQHWEERGIVCRFIVGHRPLAWAEVGEFAARFTEAADEESPEERLTRKGLAGEQFSQGDMVFLPVKARAAQSVSSPPSQLLLPSPSAPRCRSAGWARRKGLLSWASPTERPGHCVSRALLRFCGL